jgi:hypothetical protein
MIIDTAVGFGYAHPTAYVVKNFDFAGFDFAGFDFAQPAKDIVRWLSGVDLRWLSGVETTLIYHFFPIYLKRDIKF